MSEQSDFGKTRFLLNPDYEREWLNMLEGSYVVMWVDPRVIAKLADEADDLAF